jgi:hypothetical protein
MIEPGKEIPEEKHQSAKNPGDAPVDLDACPRCGELLDGILWGQTNCPRCGLHFECC